MAHRDGSEGRHNGKVTLRAVSCNYIWTLLRILSLAENALGLLTAEPCIMYDWTHTYQEKKRVCFELEESFSHNSLIFSSGVENSKWRLHIKEKKEKYKEILSMEKIFNLTSSKKSIFWRSNRDIIFFFFDFQTSHTPYMLMPLYSIW